MKTFLIITSKNKDYTELKVALVLTYVTDTVSGIM